MSSSFAPDEPASAIFAEKTFLQGTFLNGVGYGAQLLLYCICLHLLWSRRTRGQPRRSYALIAFTTIIVILGTLNAASDAAFTQDAFISDRNYTGGPAGFENDFFYIPIDTLGNVSFMLSSWSCDALMLWRFWLIFKTSNISTWLIMIFPCTLYLGTWAMGILYLIQLSVTSPWGSGSSLNWTIPWFSLSISYNIILTLAIVGRLLYYRHSIMSVLPSGAHGSHYTSIAAMIIESSLLTSSFSVLCVVPFARGSTVANIFLQPLGQVQITATLLIIYRVALGRAWSEETSATFVSKTRDTEHSAGTSESRRRPLVFATINTERVITTDSGPTVLYAPSKESTKLDPLEHSLGQVMEMPVIVKGHGRGFEDRRDTEFSQ